MIQISSIGNLLLIYHLPDYKGKAAACYLHSRFFPPGLWQRLCTMPFLSTGSNISYMLNSKEDRDAGQIFDKMQQEAGSGYLFSADLQRTYLIELIHLLLKVQQKQQQA